MCTVQLLMCATFGVRSCLIGGGILLDASAVLKATSIVGVV